LLSAGQVIGVATAHEGTISHACFFIGPNWTWAVIPRMKRPLAAAYLIAGP
jgi:hypothetical protein